MAQDQIIFKVPAEKKHALKMQCVARGVTMTDVLTQAVDRHLEPDAQPAEVVGLASAASEAVAEMELTHGVFPSPSLAEVTEALRAALKPFQAVGDD